MTAAYDGSDMHALTRMLGVSVCHCAILLQLHIQGPGGGVLWIEEGY